MKRRVTQSVISVLLVLGLVIPGCAAPIPVPQEINRIDLADQIIPNEGTIGTEFTITGSGFGDAEPAIQIGDGNCTVLEWNDTDIRAAILDTIPEGTYDVSIKPGARDDNEIVFNQAFTVMPPSIDPIEPMHIWDIDELTIQGSFFGSEIGKVFVVDQNDQAEECEVLEWCMDSITFSIPEGLSEVYDIKVQNEVGSSAQTKVLNAWVPLPGNGAPQAENIEYWVDVGAHSATTGIYFGDKFWAFWSGGYSNVFTHVVQFRQFDGNFWTDGAPLSPGPEAYSQPYNKQHSPYAPSPVIFNEKLYVFWVDGATSKINYSIYLGRYIPPGSDSYYDRWSKLNTIDIISIGEVSPVYNPARERLELYFLSADNFISWTYTNDGQKWQPPKRINKSKGIEYQAKIPPAAEAVEMFDGYQIMLAVQGTDYEDLSIYFTQDGKVNGGVGMANASTNSRPFLTNLGNHQIALLYRDQQNYVNICYYREKTGKETDPLEKQGYFYGWEKWDDKYKWTPNGYPTGVVSFTWKNDDALLAKFWVFYQQGTFNNIICRYQKELGMWKHVDTENHDWSMIDDPEIYNLYPVIGIIDMPPFVKNGNTKADQNNTKVTWGRGETTKKEYDYTATIGAFFKKDVEWGLTGVAAEVHAGVAFKWGGEKMFSKKLSYSFTPQETSMIDVFYMAPTLQMIRFRWFDESLRPTEDTMIFSIVKDLHIIARSVDPSTDPNFKIPEFPLHDAGNLNTYGAKLDEQWYDISDTVSWDAGGPSEWICSQEKSSYFSVGTYLTVRVGYVWANLISFGGEGSFTFDYKSTTTLTDTLTMVLDNPRPSVKGDIRHFNTTIYWAKPAQNGFWVPLNRRECGDTPWFITYTVTGVNVYEP